MKPHRVALLDLLATREIAHPSRLVSAKIEGGALNLVFEGWSWWRAERPEQEGRIEFVFSGVTRGTIALPDLACWELNEVLEDFSICPTQTLSWAHPVTRALYCSAPVPDPLTIYQKVEDFLQEERALKTPADFLHGAGRLSRFLDYARSSFFLLAECPPAISEMVEADLQAQNVPYQALGLAGELEAPICVRFGEHGFYCETASAVLDAD